MLAPKPTASVTRYTAAFVLTLSLFALWGMGQQLSGVLLSRISGPLHLEGVELWLSQNVPGTVYMLGAIPAALYAMRLGYKAAILFGLGCITVGCFTLSSTVAIQAHGYFLLAMTIMSLGWVFLDVSANPLAASLGSDERFVWRLNLAQAIFPLGTIAVLVTEKWLLGAHEFAGTKFTLSAAHPFIVLGAAVLLTAWLFEDRSFPPVAIARGAGGEGAALRGLLSDRLILCAMAAQGAGIIILITNGGIGGKYLVSAFHAGDSSPLSSVFFWAAMIFAAGRWAGCGLMRFISPARLLAMFAVAGVVCSVIAATSPAMAAAYAVLANQFFASIIWPTVLGVAICGRGSQTKLATALVCVGSAAGSVLYQLAVTAWPMLPAQAGMLIPAVCFMGIAAFAVLSQRSAARQASA